MELRDLLMCLSLLHAHSMGNGITQTLAVFAMAILAFWGSATALDNGLARTPPMGWNSWATYELKIDEALIRATADAMVSRSKTGGRFDSPGSLESPERGDYEGWLFRHGSGARCGHDSRRRTVDNSKN